LPPPVPCGNYGGRPGRPWHIEYMAAYPIDAYRRQIERELQAGNATEHTHRPALKALIESLGSGLTGTNELKRADCGAPDLAGCYGGTEPFK